MFSFNPPQTGDTDYQQHQPPPLAAAAAAAGDSPDPFAFGPPPPSQTYQQTPQTLRQYQQPPFLSASGSPESSFRSRSGRVESHHFYPRRTSAAAYASSLVQDDPILAQSLSRRRAPDGSVHQTAADIVANNEADPFGALSGQQAAAGYTVGHGAHQRATSRAPVIELERRMQAAGRADADNLSSISSDASSFDGKLPTSIHDQLDLRMKPTKSHTSRLDPIGDAGHDEDDVVTTPLGLQRQHSFPRPTYTEPASDPHDWHRNYMDKVRQLEEFDAHRDTDSIGGGTTEEEDSPFPEVRASVSNIDDTGMPALTARVWILGILLCVLFSGLNLFFTLRYPAPYVTSILMQILAYPLGKLLAAGLPTRAFSTPEFMQRWFGFEDEWSFNPGPFNIKEHAAIIQMTNAAITPAYAVYLTLTLDKFYQVRKGPGFDICIVLSTQMIGFAFAGICRRFLVWPASMLWPSNLVICTLLNTFHAEDDDGRDGSMTRYRFFFFIIVGAGLWYLLPDFLFVGLSTFSYICWAAPNNVVVNQLFGVANGLGMGFLTFDWSQISYIGSPLIVPFWAILNIFVGFVAIYWIITPALYYSDVWFFSHLPMFGTEVFDRFGEQYDVDEVIGTDSRFNTTAYHDYSPLYMPVTYVAVYCIAFTLSTAVLVHTALFHGKSIIRKLRNVHNETEDIHQKLMRNYPEVPDWWYFIYLVAFFGLSIVAIEIFNTGLPVWGLIMSIVLAAIYVLPGGFIFAMTSQEISINLLAEMIPGFLFVGKPIAVMTFKTFSVQSLISAFTFVQDLKLGHYMKIPPRVTFFVQVVAAIISAFVQIGVKRLLEHAVPDLCAENQASNLVCPQNAVFYSSSIIWGLIGPAKTFGADSLYRPMMWWLLVGVFLPIPFWFLAKKYPRSWVRFVNIPTLLTGASYIPPGTGINYSSWFLIGFIFQYLMRRHRFRWWSKFNFVLSAALEGGTLLSGIIIFLILQLPKEGQLELHWWGNNVYKNTIDYNPVPYKPVPSGFGPDEWS